MDYEDLYPDEDNEAQIIYLEREFHDEGVRDMAKVVFEVWNPALNRKQKFKTNLDRATRLTKMFANLFGCTYQYSVKKDTRGLPYAVSIHPTTPVRSRR